MTEIGKEYLETDLIIRRFLYRSIFLGFNYLKGICNSSRRLPST